MQNSFRRKSPLAESIHSRQTINFILLHFITWAGHSLDCLGGGAVLSFFAIASDQREAKQLLNPCSRERKDNSPFFPKPDNACCAQVVENLSLRHERHKKRTSKYILRTLRRHEPMTLHVTFSAYTATLLIWTKGGASYISAPFCRLVSQPTGYHIGISGRIRKLTIDGRRLLSAIAHIPIPSLVRMGRFSV